ncbi:MAG: M1 family metallopeptidase [Ferruginibacter sp.]
MKKNILYLWILITNVSIAQNNNATGSNHGNKFEQLETILPTPNEYRMADGSPGPKYWQQRCDYDITCELDDTNQKITGKEKISYFNNSPRTLTYLWLQLDENQHDPASDNNFFDQSGIGNIMSQNGIRLLDRRSELKDNGMKIQSLTDGMNKALTYTINQSMMRVELPNGLKPGEKFVMNVAWHYYMVDRIKTPDARGGYEFFAEDGNNLYTVSQWYPRLCVYSDFQGWQNKQFTGRGEFALTFGNFQVRMTVPSDHVVGATGECRNYPELLSPVQLLRWKQAQTSKEPLEIVTLAEAKLAMTKKEKGKKTWIFVARNVRDFAWTSSRRFIWDAMPATVESNRVMCMSYYGVEAYPLYRKFSTKTVAHTIKTYSKYSIPYPYPVAQSVEGNAGMEYPMIAFNPGRAEKDGTYSEAVRNTMLYVTIHEVGHNFFPMIVNSDERQWSWFDEGLNSFLQFLTEKELDVNFPSNRGPAYTIVDYMKLPKNQLEPVMTNSENILNFGSNAYGKPAAALNILRETVMGRKLFDYAFKAYATKWAFKHPTPSDFFRTMEDASGVDLDWFWRGWFYGVDPVDISIDSVKYYKVDMQRAPIAVDQEFPIHNSKPFEDITRARNNESGIMPLVARDTSMRDFYTNYKPWETADSLTYFKQKQFGEAPDSLQKQSMYGNKNFYELFLGNKGGQVMPVIIEWTYKDGTKEIERLPAEIWRKNEVNIRKVFIKEKEVLAIQLDPLKETADIDASNNLWGKFPAEPSRFKVFKSSINGNNPNPMQKER